MEIHYTVFLFMGRCICMQQAVRCGPIPGEILIYNDTTYVYYTQYHYYYCV